MIESGELWFVIIGLGVGSYVLRFAFLGLVGDRDLPEWLLRHLRYTAVAILPALIAPLVIWPDATGGSTDPLRLAAALAAAVIGYLTKNVFGAIVAGLVVLGIGTLIVG